MPGDPTSRNDDDLLSQIDELKARMDRLMRGGSSTSNSALLTDEVKAKSAMSEELRSAASPAPVPDRTRVRDLIEPEDTEIVEVYPVPKEVVPFPDHRSDQPVAEVSSAATAVPEPEPPARTEPSVPVGGSVIPVEEDIREPRPSVATFDELGSAIQQELAKDASVPPVDSKRGPDLASRFGPAVGHAAADEPAAPAAPEDAELPPSEEQADPDETEIEIEIETQPEAESVEYEEEEGGHRANVGAVAAIWVFAAIASGAIATLHFTGLI
ncbi:MAG: hypothetical protein U9N84_10245 [Actinomycetota bacterium]|nr:hypothetical protein [Actinomycetota bacterium]